MVHPCCPLRRHKNYEPRLSAKLYCDTSSTPRLENRCFSHYFAIDFTARSVIELLRTYGIYAQFLLPVYGSGTILRCERIRRGT